MQFSRPQLLHIRYCFIQQLPGRVQKMKTADYIRNPLLFGYFLRILCNIAYPRMGTSGNNYKPAAGDIHQSGVIENKVILLFPVCFYLSYGDLSLKIVRPLYLSKKKEPVRYPDRLFCKIKIKIR